MRRLAFAALLAALVVAALPVTAEANHTLANKMRNLQGKVAALQAKMNCLRRTGASTYAGYPYYEGIFDQNDPGPYEIHTPSTGFADSDIATLFDQATGVTASDYWLLNAEQHGELPAHVRGREEPVCPRGRPDDGNEPPLPAVSRPVRLCEREGASVQASSRELSVEPHRRC